MKYILEWRYAWLINLNKKQLEKVKEELNKKKYNKLKLHEVK